MNKDTKRDLLLNENVQMTTRVKDLNWKLRVFVGSLVNNPKSVKKSWEFKKREKIPRPVKQHEFYATLWILWVCKCTHGKLPVPWKRKHSQKHTTLTKMLTTFCDSQYQHFPLDSRYTVTKYKVSSIRFHLLPSTWST